MRTLSPGGALLRGSRVWSLPKKLPPPPTDARSPTATTGFPILQAVTTTPESRKRGDWGFKYPLPLKTTTKSSTPNIRVYHVDAPESVTDFQSASDHALTAQKFAEMKITMIQKLPKPGPLAEPPRSVFDDSHDFIHMPKSDSNDVNARNLYHKRWQFRGPWLAGMTDGEFDGYLDKAVRNSRQRGRFIYHLRKRLAARKNEDRMREDQRNGIITSEWSLLGPAAIPHEEVLKYIRYLRKNTPEMNEVVTEFLDLAPMKPSDSLGISKTFNWSSSPYAESGPPTTHPSAGMSYLRTSSYMESHPLYGPQLYHSPVRSRVIQPSRSSSGMPVVGMGGIIAKPEDLMHKTINSRINSLWHFDRTSKGGSKIWVSADVGVISPTGHIQLAAYKSFDEAEWNARELLGENVKLLRANKELTKAPMGRQAAPTAWNPNRY